MKRKKPTRKRGVRYDHNHIRLRTGEWQRPNGGYVYRWTDQYRRRHAVYADTLEELRERETQVTVDEHEGVRTNTGNITVNNMFDLWKELKLGIKDTTMKNYIYMYELFVKDSFGKLKLAKVKKSDVRRFYNNLIETRNLSVSSMDSIHNILHQVFRVAVDDNLIRNNPADNLSREFKHVLGEANKREALTIEEQKLFLSYMLKTEQFRHWYPIFYIMVNTGLRVGEITALRNADLDWKKGVIHVNHTLVYYDHRNGEGCYYSISTPKTAAGKRTVPMTEGVKDAFRMQKEYLEDANITCNIQIDGYTDFIFLNRYGTVFYQASLNRALKRIIQTCNFEILDKTPLEKEPLLLPNFTTHVLRHTFATRAAECGLGPHVLKAYLGHSDISTSMNIYVTASEEFKAKEIETYEKYINENGEESNEETEGEPDHYASCAV